MTARLLAHGQSGGHYTSGTETGTFFDASEPVAKAASGDATLATSQRQTPASEVSTAAAVESPVPSRGEAISSFRHDPVHQAMDFVDDCLPYRAAVDRCPEVVRRESPHERFLAFCNGNQWEAASRLAAYWCIRKRVFGDERAFLPLRDALADEERDYLSRGFQATMGTDRNGRAVFTADADRIPSVAPPMELRLRCIFASLQILCDTCDRSANFEIVNITKINPQQMVKMVKQEIDLVQDLLETALCVNTPAINLVIESSSPKRTVMKTLIPIILAKVGNFMSKIPMVVHLGTPGENLANLLKANGGLEAHLIPASVGGTWSYDRDWPAVLRKHGVLTAAVGEEQPPLDKPAAAPGSRESVPFGIARDGSSTRKRIASSR